MFVFSVPFETGFGLGRAVSVAKLLGIAVALVALLQPRLCFRRPTAPFWAFACYAAFVVLRGAFAPSEFRAEIVSHALMLFQMLMLFWLGSNLLRFERVANAALDALVASCSLLAILQLLGVTEANVADTERVSALGEDPNTVAAVLAIGVLVVVGRAYGQRRRDKRSQWLVWTAVVLIAGPLIRTGSRGGLVALGAGLLVLVLRRGGAAKKVRNLFAVAAIVGLLVVLTLRSEVNVNRWERTLEGGSVAGREFIFPAAWGMFVERPIVGWGPVVNFYELGPRVGARMKDTHNVILLVLTQVGLIGAIPWLAGIVMCCIGAWRARLGPRGVFPLALLVGVLVVNMSVTWQNRKLHWIALSFTVASAAVTLREDSRAHRTKRPAADLQPIDLPIGAVRRVS